MGTMALTRGDAATLDIDDLQAPDPITHLLVAAQFQAGDVLVWTAKARIGGADSTAIIQKTSPAGITIAVGGNSASVSILATDWTAVHLNADLLYEWDLEYRPLAVAANAVTIAQGEDTIYADVSGNTSVATPTAHGGLTCSPWATNADALAPFNVGVDAFELDTCMQQASDILYEFTRRKYRGTCTDEIRPLARWRAYEGPRMWWSSLDGFPRSRYGWCSCNRSGNEYGCTSMPMIRLPGYPVDAESIVVTIDGVPFTDFLLLDKRNLIRTDDEGWLCCQDLTLATTEDNTWKVRYEYGVAPPLGGKRAAVLLGQSLYAAMHPSDDLPCALPQRVTSVTRQGVSLAILDPLTLFQGYQTGIPVVDLWIAADRAGDAQRATLLDPAGGRRRSVTRTL